ncbi:MAG: hypothetical protein O2955_02410 [Planctomycetota bacterium]|nr:hypothetical protein [Planctomycetota bacterium]MDA1211337.1 hypothetical protein [Planctomycetota bacterium]
MSIGLDLTSTCFRSLRPEGQTLAVRSCRADIVPVSKSPIHRQLVDQLQLNYAECDSHLLIWGDQANRYADAFHSSSLPLLVDGCVPDNQPPIRQMLASLMEGLLPTTPTSGRICGVAFSRSQRATRQSTVDFFTQLISLSGYRVTAVAPAQALALAELSSCEYSGIVLHLGAAVSDFCVMQHGAILWKQQLDLYDFLPADVNDDYQSVLLTSGCDNTETTTNSTDMSNDVMTRCRVMQSAMEHHFAGLAAAEVFTPTSNAVPLLLGGECPRGSDVISGMQHDMASLSGPIPISEVRWPLFGDHAVARGCLIHAELESKRAHPQAA